MAIQTLMRIIGKMKPYTRKQALLSIGIALFMALGFAAAKATQHSDEFNLLNEQANNTTVTDPAAKPNDDDTADIDVNDEESFIKASLVRQYLDPAKLRLHSSVALILDNRENEILFEKDIDEKRPIASITKLMTAMVILDAKLDMDEEIKITRADRDRLRGSRSRIGFGTKLIRKDLLFMALAASENRASAALSRTYPGGKDAFVTAMNAKAKALGMTNSHFVDSSGLHSENYSTARDLAKMARAAMEYPEIIEMTTSGEHFATDLRSGHKIEFMNTNRLVRRKQWNIGLSKTGYIADAGHCLVMQTDINGRPLIVVLLNSWGKYSKFGDANRIKTWLTRAEHKVQQVAGI